MQIWLLATFAVLVLVHNQQLLVTSEPESTIAYSDEPDGSWLFAMIPIMAALILVIVLAIDPNPALREPALIFP